MGPSPAVGTGRQAEAAPVLAQSGSAGWAVAVSLCSLEGGFGLWLGCMLLGSQVALAFLTKNAPEGLAWMAFLSALLLAV